MKPRLFFIYCSLTICLLILKSTPNIYSECGNLPPVAKFTYSPLLPYTRQTITFNATASYDSDGFISSYIWEFDDGNFTKVTFPIITHYYSMPGNYNVRLTVKDNYGLNSSVTKTVSVLSRIIASFSYWPANPLVCKPVTFNASDSRSEGGYIVNYSWNFGDQNLTVTSEPITIHHFIVEGLYLVELNVTDNFGGWSTFSQILNISKPQTAPPTAFFSWTPSIPEAWETVIFNASESTPNGGEITLYSWDFGDNTTETTLENNICHVYQSFGNYTVVLNITDSEGESDNFTSVIRIVEKPIADFFFAPSEIRVSTKVTFNGSISDSRGGYIVEYKWNFGDGSPETYGDAIIHRFLKMGEFTVSLNVTDSEGKWNVKSLTLKILPHIADLNEDGTVNIIDMSIFAKAFGSYPGHPRWNPKADITGNNIVNILDGVIIARAFDPSIDPFDP